jgi:DNA-directed RNA polymerase subunit K
MMWPKDEFTRFEVARILGARALQISLGAPVLVKTEQKYATDIAKDEFKNGMIPITIKRELPDKTKVAVDAKIAIKKWIESHGGEV